MTTAAELATKADAYKAFRDRRLELAREVDDLKTQEAILKRELISALEEAGTPGIIGNTCEVRLTYGEQPIVEDWDTLYEYIRSEDAFDLLERRIGVTAVRVRWDEDIPVPGVGRITTTQLSVTKRK